MKKPLHVPKEVETCSVVWSGMGGNSYQARQLQPIIEKLGMKLVIISEWDDATVKWNKDTYLQEMAKCDIAICPQRVDLQPAKSNVKLTQAMSLGMPVICSPLPAYLECVQHNVNGLVAYTLEDWENHLGQLKDLKERQRIGSAAFSSVSNYSPKATAQKWTKLLSVSPQDKKKVAFVNNTLWVKYLSYGDYWLDAFKQEGHQVDEFKYEQVDKLPVGYDLYFFIERRYNPEDIADVHPRALYTIEEPNLDTLPHFDYIFCGTEELYKRLLDRGFVNVFYVPNENRSSSLRVIWASLKNDLVTARKASNEARHTADINAFTSLQLPESRWETGSRDQAHMKYCLDNIQKGETVLDIGSADGWLSIYLASKGFDISALEVVARGLEWTKTQAQRLGVSLDLRKGFVEDVCSVFSDKKFDVIMAYEILEHLDYLRVPEYLKKLESLLTPKGRILISLPKQNMKDNPEHLWSPSETLIAKLFGKKTNVRIDWTPIPNHGVPGNWFISYGQGVSQKVDIIIPSYKNLKYLQLTIDSVRRNTKNYNLIVVNSGQDEGVRDYLRNQTDIKLIDSVEKSSFSKSINVGLRNSKNDVVLLNNDVIVGQNWLEELINSPFDITNPFSNCDKGWIHNLNHVVGGVELRPNMVIDDVDTELLMATKSPYSEVFPREWVAFYATFIKRKVIEETGLLDESFVNGGEDFDYCRRAGRLGFTCGHKFPSFVFHFGGKTRKVSETENYQQHHAEDEANHVVMRHKAKPTVVIYTGPAWERWTINNINTTGIGGSETCAAKLAAEFAKMGLRSVLVGDCEGQEGTIDGVEYLDWKKFDAFKEVNYVDYFIASRTTAPLSHRIRNGKNFVWVHDIWLQAITNAERIAKFVCLSPWHVDFFNQHHGVSKDKIIIQSNGLDFSRYDKQVERDPYRLIYSSSPDRGLITLLDMFGPLKKRFPQLSLHIFYGFENWQKAIAQRNNPQEMQHMNAILKKMQQDGVVYHGRVSQAELAEEQLRSTLWVYPTNFTETFCITATECMLAGAIPITTDVAALMTTIPPNCGIKIKSVEQGVEEAAKLLNDPLLQEKYRKAGKDYVLANFGWPRIAREWLQNFQKY